MSLKAASGPGGSSTACGHPFRRSPSCWPRPMPISSSVSRSPRPTAVISEAPSGRIDRTGETGRRAKIVRILPDRSAAVRLVGVVLTDRDGGRQDGRCRFRPETMALIGAVTSIEEASQHLGRRTCASLCRRSA